jgi:hypothetical protein
MLTAREIQIARNEAVREIDIIFSNLLRTLENPALSVNANPDENFDKIYPLSFNAAEFKGKKPTSLYFGREIVPIYSWKMVFAKVMERCSADPNRHKALMDLRSKISGKARLILSDRPDGMRAPLEIAHKLYAETHYDTGTLLHILTRRILDPIGYDYSDIYVAVRSGK